jgi:glycosyltransferase involved in cell wall biosynthesis
MMLCSVIIPLYNKEAFIKVALQSILNQQYQNFEVIVVDDGSTDNGGSLVGTIQDQRIQLIKQANAGVSCARNRGIELAKGELVCFLDADDWYHPMYLETMVFMATHYSEINVFAANSLVFGKLDTPIMAWDVKIDNNFLVIDDLYYDWSSFGGFFCTNSVAIRREFLISFQPCFPPGESMGEDLDLWFRLAEASTILYCATRLVAYRYMDGSLCDTNKDLITLLPVYSRIEQRIRDGQMPNKFRSSALRMVLDAKVSIARKLLMKGRRYDAYMELLGIYGGIRSRRWWVSLIMCAIFSPFLAIGWERWRDPSWRD